MAKLNSQQQPQILAVMKKLPVKIKVNGEVMPIFSWYSRETDMTLKALEMTTHEQHALYYQDTCFHSTASKLGKVVIIINNKYCNWFLVLTLTWSRAEKHLILLKLNSVKFHQHSSCQVQGRAHQLLSFLGWKVRHKQQFFCQLTHLCTVNTSKDVSCKTLEVFHLS